MYLSLKYTKLNVNLKNKKKRPDFSERSTTYQTISSKNLSPQNAPQPSQSTPPHSDCSYIS